MNCIVSQNLLAITPETYDRPLLEFETFSLIDESSHDSLNTTLEFMAGEVVVYQLHLLGTTFSGKLVLADFDETNTQCQRQTFYTGPTANPDTIDQRKSVDIFRHRLCHDHCCGSTRRTLIVTKLREPSLAEVLGPLGLPQDATAAGAIV